MALKEFVEYVMGFYGPGGLYASLFPKPFTRREVTAATKLRMASADYAGDSFDREAVRDLVLQARGLPAMGL